MNKQAPVTRCGVVVGCNSTVLAPPSLTNHLMREIMISLRSIKLEMQENVAAGRRTLETILDGALATRAVIFGACGHEF